MRFHARQLSTSERAGGASPRAAFTLIELLVVVAVMALLTALSLPAMRGLSGSRNLESSGNIVVDLSNQARQNSMTKGVLTAVVLINGSTNPEWNNRLFILLQLSPGTKTWIPASKWTMLPTGVVVDATQSSSFMQQMPTPPYPLGTLSYAGKALSPSTYVYQVFTSTGQILVNGIPDALPPALRLTQGVMNQSSLVYTAGSTNNYYDVTLNLYTGTPTVDRP